MFIQVEPTQVINFDNVSTIVKAKGNLHAIHIFLQNGIKIELTHQSDDARDAAFDALVAQLVAANK